MPRFIPFNDIPQAVPSPFASAFFFFVFSLTTHVFYEAFPYFLRHSTFLCAPAVIMLWGTYKHLNFTGSGRGRLGWVRLLYYDRSQLSQEDRVGVG